MIPKVIKCEIFNFLSFYYQHKFSLISKETFDFNITNLHNIDRKYKKNITDAMLIKYVNVTKLSCTHVVDFSFLTKLKILQIRYHISTPICRLTNLESLDISNCRNIIDLNKLTNLKKLKASCTELCDENIDKLNLEELDISWCYKITNINHMTNLKILNVSHNCQVDDHGVMNLNPTKLIAYNNNRITCINHMTNLLELNIGGNKIGIDNIDNLNLKKLDISDNFRIKKINHMKNLEELNMQNTNLNNDDLLGLNLRKLYVSQITTVNLSKMSSIEYIGFNVFCVDSRGAIVLFNNNDKIKYWNLDNEDDDDNIWKYGMIEEVD